MKKRLHPIRIGWSLLPLVRNAFFPALFLFVFQSAAEARWVVWGRWGFLVFVAVSLAGSVAAWWFFQYEFRNGALHVYSGVFIKSEQRVVLERIQNIQRHTSLFHRLFKVTSLSLETGGEAASVKLNMITRKEAARIEKELAGESTERKEGRTVHYQASSGELLKASFTSFSFFAVVPLLASVYFTADDFFQLDGLTKEAVNHVAETLWLLAPILIVLILLGTAVGVAVTFLKYGNSLIMSDEEHIYLKKGMLNENVFTITKNKVQAVKWKQSLLKRWFGLVEVELISAGNTEEGEKEINSLFPFLPVGEAARIMEELLPAYRVESGLERLPTRALWLKLLRVSWIWAAATAGLLWWQPSYWYASLLLLVLLITGKWLAYKEAGYLMTGSFIQLRSGMFATELFVTTREKIQEINVKKSILQRKGRLATIQIASQSRPVHYTSFADVTDETAQRFYQWYVERNPSVRS